MTPKFCLNDYFFPFPQKSKVIWARDPISKPVTGQRPTLQKKNATSMSSIPGPTILSRGTGQQIACCDNSVDAQNQRCSCRDGAALLVFKVMANSRTDGWTYEQSRDNFFLDRWLSKFPKVSGSTRTPLECRSSAIIRQLSL